MGYRAALLMVELRRVRMCGHGSGTLLADLATL